MRPAPEKALVETASSFAVSRPHTAAHWRNRRDEPRDLTATLRSSHPAMSAPQQSASTPQRFSDHPYVQQSSQVTLALGHLAGLSVERVAPTLEPIRGCRLDRVALFAQG